MRGFDLQKGTYRVFIIRIYGTVHELLEDFALALQRLLLKEQLSVPPKVIKTIDHHFEPTALRKAEPHQAEGDEEGEERLPDHGPHLQRDLQKKSRVRNTHSNQRHVYTRQPSFCLGQPQTGVTGE